MQHGTAKQLYDLCEYIMSLYEKERQTDTGRDIETDRGVKKEELVSPTVPRTFIISISTYLPA